MLRDCKIPFHVFFSPLTDLGTFMILPFYILSWVLYILISIWMLGTQNAGNIWTHKAFFNITVKIAWGENFYT